MWRNWSRYFMIAYTILSTSKRKGRCLASETDCPSKWTIPQRNGDNLFAPARNRLRSTTVTVFRIHHFRLHGKMAHALHKVFSLVDAAAGTLLPGDVVSLSNQSNVNYISLDRQVGPLLDISAPTVGADLAWRSGWDGTGVGIALIDSGIASHPDLQSSNGLSRIVYRQNFIDRSTGDSLPCRSGVARCSG